MDQPPKEQAEARRRENKERAEARRRENEKHARDLFRQLVVRFGEGCNVQLERSGHKFLITMEQGLNQSISEVSGNSGVLRYLCSFIRDGDCIAKGRTTSLEEVIDALEQWLWDTPSPVFSESFPFAVPTFILERRESLRQLRKEITALAPPLTGLITFVLQKDSSPWPFDHLEITKGERYCRLALGQDQFWMTSLNLQDCELCTGKVATLEEILVPIQRWICERAMPSKLHAELPWIKIVDEELIPYFEQDRGWEGICFISWKRVEEFYAEYCKDLQFLKEIKNLMAEMRSRGYDKTLRAGTSIWSLILSRSRNYGLRAEQPRLAFWLTREGMEVWPHPDGTGHLKFASSEYTPEIDVLLKQLEACEID